MSSTSSGLATTFDRLLAVWNGADPDIIRTLITSDYAGHLLHLASPARNSEQYPEWIRTYRERHPGVTFSVEAQLCGPDTLWTRLRATLPDGRVAHGMNTSRFAQQLIAEEWALWSRWFLPSER